MRLLPLTVFFAMTVGPVEADTYDLLPVNGNVFYRDVQNLGDAVGVKTDIFDYEVPFSHCVRLSAELQVDSDPVENVYARGVCTEAGPHRLTVQWREKDSEVLLYFYLYHRDTGQNSGMGGPRIDIAGYGMWTRDGNSPPVLEIGQRNQVVAATYHLGEHNESTGRWEQNSAKRVVVFAELASNPNNKTGTE